jgi:hypothetical protein
MGALYEALVNLSPVHDDELLHGYRRYEELLTTILTPEQMDHYAMEIRQSGDVRIFEEMNAAELTALSPEMQVISREIMANETIAMENRRVVALLHQRGQEAVAPDFGSAQTGGRPDLIQF